MPELAEVLYHSSLWKPSCGERMEVAWAHGATRCFRGAELDAFAGALDGAKLLSVSTHGKRMLFGFSGGVFLEAHLGMTGSLHRFELGYEESKHDHLALRGERAILVFRDPRQFGSLALHRGVGGGFPDWWKALPAQPQSAAFTWEGFELGLARRGGSVLKALLLQQEHFPGVGNWMADEILWRARLRPDRRFGSLDEMERKALFRETVWVCREAIRIIGADYSDPPISWLFRHRWKDGGICPVAKEPLRRDTVGGRTTCWSPRLQV